MRDVKALRVFTATLVTAGMVTSSVAFAGDNVYSVDMTAGNESAWAQVAMANDDTVTSGVYIRESNSENSKVVGYLYRGGAVTVLDKGDGWTEVTSGDVTGYVKNEYLVYGSEAKGLAEYYGSYGVAASWNDVNVFASGSAGAAIIDTVDDGTAFLRIESDGHWVTVQNGADSVAYVSEEDVDTVILMNTAVSVDDADSNAAAQKYSSSIEAFAGSSSSYQGSGASASTDTTYTEPSYEEPSYTDTSYEEVYYEEPSYTDTSSEEVYYYEEPSYEEPTYTYEEPSYTEPAYEEPSYTEPTYTYTEPSTDGMSLAEKAQTLYQAYLTAQEAADNAVANGASEQTIIDTAAAAQQAYAVYVAAQNKADEASWGVSSDTSSQTVETEAPYVPETEAPYVPETEAPYVPETEAPQDNSSSVSSSDLELLAALIYCEAGNQSYEGQVAVGAVVMNRVASGSFPSTISDVIYQSGQFTPAFSGGLASALANGSGSNYIAAASAAMAGEDPTGGALYFNTHQGSGVKIGAHWFF